MLRRPHVVAARRSPFVMAAFQGYMSLLSRPVNGYFQTIGDSMAKVAVLVADAFQDSEYFLPKIEIEKLGVETETVSISKTSVEIYSFFRAIGHLNIDWVIDEANPRAYMG